MGSAAGDLTLCGFGPSEAASSGSFNPFGAGFNPLDLSLTSLPTNSSIVGALDGEAVKPTRLNITHCACRCIPLDLLVGHACERLTLY